MRNLQIETDLKYSSGDSYDFEENFHTIKSSSRGTCGLYQYTKFGNEPTIEMGDLKGIDGVNTLKRDLLEYALSVDWNHYTKTEIRTLTKQELVDLIDENSDFGYMSLNEVEKELHEANIGCRLDGYEIYTSRGYSQGNTCQVIIRNELVDNHTKKYIDHYLWDSRIYGAVNVLFSHTKNAVNYDFDKEFEFYEVCKDEYEANLNVDYIIRQINKEVLIPLSDDECEQIRIKLRDVDYTDVKYPCAC